MVKATTATVGRQRGGARGLGATSGALGLVVPSLLLVIACVLGSGGCSGSNSAQAADGGAAVPPQDGGGSGSLPCEVDALLERRCRGCHGSPQAFGAPMPLVHREDLLAGAPSDPRAPVWERIRARVSDDGKPMPPPPNERLSGEEKAALEAWFASGLPEAGGGSCGNPQPGGGSAQVGELSCTPDLSVRPQSAYAMPTQTGDQYACYGMDVAAGPKRHVVAIAPRIDNSTIVHHVLLYQAPNAVSGDVRPCQATPGFGYRLVYGWAPGGPNLAMPPEAGFPLEAGGHFVVQLHYSNIKHLAGQEDRSGFDLCTTTELRPNDADVLAFGTHSISVPAHGSQDSTCDLKVPAQYPELHVVAAFPHMHQIGTTIATTLLPKEPEGAAPVDLGAREVWNFESQPWLPVSAVVRPGDTVRTRCAWANPTDRAIRFGEKTQDEMCYSFTMYWPRITSAGWSWLVPAQQARCQPTVR